MILFFIENKDVIGIVVSVFGYVNLKIGFIIMGGVICRFDNFNLKEWFEVEIGIFVVIENDVNCVFFVEKWFGKG